MQYQDKSEAVLTASVPYAFLQKLWNEPAIEVGPETQPRLQKAPTANTKSQK